MSRTYRRMPSAYNRRPRHKHKLLAGESPKAITTDWDDKPVAALGEIHPNNVWWYYRRAQIGQKVRHA